MGTHAKASFMGGDVELGFELRASHCSGHLEMEVS
jgi:hypothetical protein